jgi:hypothetical protein
MKKSHRKNKFNLLNFKGGSCSTNTLDTSQYTNPNGIIKSQDGYQNIFERVFLSPESSATDLTVPSCDTTPTQTGAGYTLDFTDPIVNRPVVHGYPDCCPPVIQNGQLILSNGSVPQCGAGRKRSHKQKPIMHKKGGSRHKSINRSIGKNTKKRSSKRKVMKKSYRKNQNQYGGDGEDSIFTPDMNNRDFGCNQPNWNPKCV